MEHINISIFKAYDIRGIYPTEIDGDLVFKISQAYAKYINPKTIIVGHDMRLCGKEFSDRATEGLVEAGVNVIDIGLVSTDQLYFAVVDLKTDGGIMATASHNPKEFGGLKLVRQHASPISGDSGIYNIRDLVVGDNWQLNNPDKGHIVTKSILDDYYKHVLKTFDIAKFKPFKVVANANFGMANPAIEKLSALLPIKFIKVLNDHLDGNFPKGPSDPLLPSNRPETIAAIKELKPDFGAAWDGDADRCFFFDENGEFITPAYINAILAEYYLSKFPGAKILHDTRVVRVIDYTIEQNGGIPIMTKAGHSFIKERMIKEDAVFGNETSGHYYFKDNFYLDNGLFPFLAVLDVLSQHDKPFSEILRPLREKFFISEELNFAYQNADILERIKSNYIDAKIDNVDGYDFNYPDWRFNARISNTQNLLRINVEADSADLLKQKISEISDLIDEIK
jgi:phosphomannomutase